MADLDSIFVGVAAYGLAGSRIDLPGEPLPEMGWSELVERCRAGQLVGFLARAARGDLALTTAQAEHLSVLEIEAAGLSLLVEQRTLTACAMLDAAGVEHRVVNGPARDHLVYAGSGIRTYDMVDVAVTARDLDVARRLPGLSAPNLTAPAIDDGAPIRRPHVEVRAHVLPEAWHGGRVGIEDLSPGAPLELAGRRIVSLTAEEQLLAACVELAVDQFTPRWLLRMRDVAELALFPQLDSGQVRRLADRWHAAELVAEMLALVWQVFDLADQTDLSVWALRLNAARAHGGSARRRRHIDRSTSWPRHSVGARSTSMRRYR